MNDDALMALSHARTALDDPGALDVPELPLDRPGLTDYEQWNMRCVYAIDRIDEAMGMLGANAETLWERDDVQFPRLLAEMWVTCELDDDLLRPVADSMDLDLEEVIELFTRAQTAWDAQKARM